MTRVKICGLVHPEDARAAAATGAEFLGLVFAPSPRQVRLADVRSWVPDVRAAHPSALWVGVFVDADPIELADIRETLTLDLVQVHGTVPHAVPDRWIRAVSATELAAPSETTAPWAWLVDSGKQGGSGRTFDWSRLPPPPHAYRLFLAGGLDPDNVAQAIRTVRPYAVDASSRLERSPGQKDPARIRAFMEEVRRADALAPLPEGEIE